MATINARARKYGGKRPLRTFHQASHTRIAAGKIQPGTLRRGFGVRQNLQGLEHHGGQLYSNHLVILDGPLFQAGAFDVIPRKAYHVTDPLAGITHQRNHGPSPEPLVPCSADLVTRRYGPNNFVGRKRLDIVGLQKARTFERFSRVLASPFAFDAECEELAKDLDFLDPGPVDFVPRAERDQQLGEGRAQEQLRLEAVIGSSCGYRKVTFFFRRIVAARFIADGLSGLFPDCRYTSTTFLRGSQVCVKRDF